MHLDQYCESDEPGFQIGSCFNDEDVKGKSNGDLVTNYMRYKELCKDQQLMQPFVKAINQNKHIFKDKIVLEINCGLGTLTVLAALAGAKHVYATESSSMADYAETIMKDNGVQNKVTILRDSIDNLKIDGNQVDIIICQWMGYFMLFGSMVDKVITARDKYLSKNGLIFPDRGTLFLASIEDEEYRNKKFAFWNKVYGVDMKCMRDWVLTEPPVERINNNQVNSEPCAVFELDLYKAKISDLDFSNSYVLNVTRNDYVHGMIGWFEVHFSSCHLPIKISTAPFSKETHWKQTIFYLKDALVCYRNDQIKGSIAVKKRGEELDILISAHLSNSADEWNIVQYYRMN